MVCKYVKGQSLMVNVLWEVAYGVCKEVLCLDPLEDFNATEADLMELKNNILTMWESRDRCRTLSLGPTFTPLYAGANDKRSTLGDTFTPLRLWHMQVPFMVPAMAWERCHHPSQGP